MKTNLLKSILAVAALLVGLGASAQDEKFYFGVTGYDKAGAPATIDATVYGDLSFKINLPSEEAKIGASKAFVQMTMWNVTSLGFEAGETRHWENTYETGVTVSDQTLSSYLQTCFTLGKNGSVTLPVHVVDYFEGGVYQDFTYNIAGTGSQIVGTPSSSDDALKAWSIITNEVTTNHPDAGGDSQFILKKGAYLCIGNKKFECANEVDLLEGNWTSGSVEDLFNKFSQTDVESSNKVVLYLPAGSSMKVDQSIATLKNPATITLDFASLDKTAFDNILDGIMEAASSGNDKRLTIINSLILFDNFVMNAVDAGTVKATVQFGAPTEGFILVYAGKEQPEEGLKTVEEFNEIRKSKLNAVGYVDADVAEAHAAELRGVDNIVVKYPAGKFGNYYYECANLVLTDVTETVDDPKEPAKTDFYSPESFVAVSGGYKWTEKSRNNTIMCFPFELKQEDVPTAQLYTFAFLDYRSEDSQFVYFQKRDDVKAGTPIMIYDTQKNGLTYDFNNTYIVGTPNNGANYQGTFIYTDKYAGSYTVYKSGNTEQLGKATKIAPFRGCLSLEREYWFNDGSNQTGASVKLMIAYIDENGDATSIDGVSLGNKNAQTIYTINGVKVSKITKPGLYIVNGVKRFCK